MARLWDLPGAGGREWPLEDYVRLAGLRHFDGVLLVTSGAFTETAAWQEGSIEATAGYPVEAG